MIFEVRQLKKDLFTADFEIAADGSCFGRMNLQGAITTIEGVWSGTVFGSDIKMQRIKKSEVPCKDSIFRPYGIWLDGRQVGFVYQSEKKSGFMKSYTCQKMNLFGEDYSLYIIGRGEESYAYPIYKGDTQIAEMQKERIVYNDLHTFKAFTTEEENCETVAAIYVMYLYVKGIFKPGEKKIVSVSKTYSLTKDKELLKKYDPSFISSHFVV